MGASLRPQSPSSAVAARMRRQRRRDTDPEVRLRRELHARGLRFRLHREVPGRPRRTIDIAFVGPKVAVFVDGCFWHVCPQHATWPRANGDWWKRKLEDNRSRDRDTDNALSSAGWRIVRVWEHEVTCGAADRVEGAVRHGLVMVR